LADAGPFTFVAADALTMKVREHGRMVNAVVLVATGVNGDGHREVLGVKVGQWSPAPGSASVTTSSTTSCSCGARVGPQRAVTLDLLCNVASLLPRLTARSAIRGTAAGARCRWRS
jgi:Transposase, Mutator family